MSVDVNKIRTYKNKMRNKEVTVIAFFKDLLALVALGGFSAASLTWLDVATRLV
jgi:hypothetical protein